MVKIVGVRFRNAGKVYYFNPNDLQVRIGDHVIAETSKGPEYGTISTCTKMVDEDLVLQPLRSLVRKATEEDEEKIAALRIKEREALKVCREKVREHELDMKMVDAEYSFDASKVLFYFTADGRVDFRNLVKDLAAVFHVRIELRQIGVRDETRILGGIGICGRELCCATYLREFQPVSIKMAKEQNLSLNPAKISGTCGRLMCCLKNEEATYEFLNAKMPKMGEEAITSDGMVGKVVELDVLRQRVRVLFEADDTKELETFPVAELTFRPRKKKDPSAQGKKNKAEKNDPEHKMENGKSAEGKAENGKSAEGRPAKGKNAEGRPEKGKNAEGKAENGKSVEGKAEHGKSVEVKAEHGKNTGGKSGHGKNAGGKPGRGKGGEGKEDSSEKNDRAARADRHDKTEHSERKHSRHKKQNRPEGHAGQGGRDGAQGEGGNDENKGSSKRSRRNRSRRQNPENHQGAPGKEHQGDSGESHRSAPAQERGGNSAE